jgi:hypothetical protein
MSNRHIDINIERLILQGFDPRHRARIAESVQRELEDLVVRHGMPPRWMHGEPSAQGIPRIEVDPGQPPARIGASVARAIYRGGK